MEKIYNFDLISNKPRTKKRNKIIIIVVLLFYISLLILSVTVSANIPVYKVAISTSPVNENEIETHYIKASSYYDYGKQVALRFPYILVNAFAVNNGGMSSEEENEINSIIENMSDDFHDELEGFSDKFDISTTEAMYLIRTFTNYLPITGECTTALATKKATKEEGNTYLIQTIDSKPSVKLTRMLYSLLNINYIVLPGFYRYASLGIPFVSEYPLINEKKLAWGGNGLSYRDYGDLDNGSGWPTFFLELLAIRECETVSEVNYIFQNNIFGGNRLRASGLVNYKHRKWPHHWDGDITSWADGNGDIVVIEQTHSYYEAKFVNPNNPLFKFVLWHANHHLWLDPSETGSKTAKECPSSYARTERAKKLLYDNYNNINMQICMDIIRDHGGGYPNKKDSYDICRHRDTSDNHNTAIGWITDVKNQIIYYTNEQPCHNKFITFNFGDIFDAFNSNFKQLKYTFFNYPAGYYFQNGPIPYLFDKLEDENFFLSDYNNSEYKTYLVVSSFLSDLMMTSNNKQINHDYSVSLYGNGVSKNETLFNLSFIPDGVVNSSLVNDYPENNTWTTIQKAIDNMSALDVLVVEQGNYTENIIINKSLIIFGADKNNVKLYGSVTMNNPHDYELLDETDCFANVNMTGLSLLLHFNNHSLIGENYSNSTNIFDYSPQCNNGTNNNATFTTQTIKGNGAFVFNGTNNSIDLPSIPALTGENVTVSSWIYWKQGTGDKDTILSQSNDTLGYCLYVNSTNSIPMFRLDTTSVVASSSINEGWHNIVGTHNSTTLKIYVDGVLSNSTSKSGSGTNRNAYIGFDNISSYFNGTIDEIAVWNRTLSNSEIYHIHDQHFGVVIDGFTIRNGNIGIRPVNHTDITNCIIQNFTTGILLENVSDIKIQCNFSDCITSLSISNNNPDEFNRIRVMDSCFDGNTEGIIIYNTSNIDICRVVMNDSVTPLDINNSNFSFININNMFSAGNSSPDFPDISGPCLGDVDTNYTYYVYTNDTDDDPILFYIDWGDGNNTGWFGPLFPSYPVYKPHSWTEQGGYYVKVKAKDIFYNETSWSTPILFKTETLPPIINSVNDTPDTVGFGYNVTITANVTENTTGNFSGIKTVRINITYPDDSYKNLTMIDMGNNTYQRVFIDTWLVGQYNYSIWAIDNAYNNVTSSGHSFNVSVDATISVCTVNSSYGGNDTVNLTDPPGCSYLVGYELLDDGKVLHIWNKYDNYYFNTSSGIQLTNHFDDYWSHNVLMLGYYNNDQWNLIYRTDELSGFNKDIVSDNETFVNVTLWKNLNYEGYDFRLAIRYYLGVDDNELTVIPYIKNIDNEDIPYDLGFAWEIKDIQIDMTTENDYIDINGTTYYLNISGLNETYINLDDPCFYIREDTGDNRSESLYLRWDKSLNYKVQVKSRDGQYNAPVTLGIKIGTLVVGQEKYTEMFWHDACEATYYYNSYDNMVAWATTPGYMVDSYTQHYASTTSDFDVELCNGNTCSGTDLGTISKVEIRCFGKRSGSGMITPNIILYTMGGNHIFSPTTTGDWSSWYDITNDPSAPDSWTWTDVDTMVVEVRSFIQPSYTLYCSKVEVRVTYNANPVYSSNYPVSGSNGISVTPVLNITINDADGDSMNITWLSNSSGSWQVFGTNSSVGNGTYHQTFSNATVNGQWWYWKVNVSDGTNYVESGVFSFFTGYQSKIENTGSTNFTGYLLMQIEYYNTTNSTWVLEQEVVNETTPRTINGSDVLALDTIFNPYNVSTSSFTNGDGTYRIYVAFRNPDGNILVTDNETELMTTYEFTVTFD